MASSVLVVGGTGPTGPHVLQGLLARGHDVTIFHRGTHEPTDLPEVRHIHGDPHFAETIDEAVGKEQFDVVIAAYGRTKLLGAAFRDRVGHFIAVGGPPRYAGFNEPSRTFPAGLRAPVRESDPLAPTIDATGAPSVRFGQQLVASEDAVFEAHPTATYLIYPMVYGPRNVWPWEWSVIKRLQDGRSTLLVPDEGLQLHSRGAVRNLAEFVLLAVDKPESARGQVFNCADDVQYTVRQWVELVATAAGASPQLVSVPSAIAPRIKAMYVPTSVSISDHSLLDTSKGRELLGYRDVVTAQEALEELLAWYAVNPLDVSRFPALVDRFDYDYEDQLLRDWTRVCADVFPPVEGDLPPEVHPMPHPKDANQTVDEKAR